MPSRAPSTSNLAGLLAIPEEVYEAGSLDGATGWKQFTNITLPLMAGYVVINTAVILFIVTVVVSILQVSIIRRRGLEL